MENLGCIFIFGSIIKYHRIRSHLTQTELCNGICSVTHLSKIENNNKEVDPETISLLLNRLGIRFSDIMQTNEEINNKLSSFSKSMVYYEIELARELYLEIIKLEDQISLSDKVYLYHLYLFRYYLIVNETTKAKNKKDFLQEFSYTFSQHESHLFQFYNAILLLKQDSYTEAIKLLNSLEAVMPIAANTHGEFYYQLSLCYSNLNVSSRSITYAHKAIREFSSQYNYYRMIHSQVLLAMHYTELGLYYDANEHYEHLLRNVNIVNGKDLLATIHHNYAILCEKEHNYEKAIYHYSIAQKNALNSQQYILSLCNLTEILINQGEHREAQGNIVKILKNTSSRTMKKQNLIFQYYKYILVHKEKEANIFLEKKVIPYLERNNLSKEIDKFALVLAEYFNDINKDKSIFYYKKIGKIRGICSEENNGVNDNIQSSTNSKCKCRR